MEKKLEGQCIGALKNWEDHRHEAPFQAGWELHEALTAVLQSTEEA